MATYIAGAGGGGKGGGGSARVAVEAPNTLKSKSYAKIVEVLCEGEIEGLAEGMQSIYLDNTPLQNADGTFNFEDVVVETREGTLAQSITKIGTTTESTATVGAEVKQATPVTYTITNGDVDRARITIRIPALTKQNISNGDLSGSEVKLLVEYNPNGAGWIQPPIGYVTSPISVNGFTGVTTASGSYSLTSAYTTEYYCSINEDGQCKYVKRYSPTIVSLQYKKDTDDWVTFKTFTFSKTATLPFTLPVIDTSVYSIRATLSNGGSASLSFLNGTNVGGDITITGKTTSPYERDVEFSLTGSAPWIVRVTRITPDSSTASLQDKTFLSSVTSVFEEKFRYPATAYVAMSINAEQFSSIPSRAYDVKMLKIKIPTNYDPIARTYSGVWDGTFKVEWSDNPAWCFYDLITNKRYGLGERIDATQVDKWALYDIAQYCDELVDNGDGVLEPRFTCNVLIQTREEAYKVLQDMASIFAGITYWGSTSDGFQGIIPVQDKPEDTISYLFTNTNVVDGVFSYQTANVSTQYNAIYVTYNDPLDEYKQKVVYIGDDDAIAQDEFVNDTNIVAFGCTSRAQAVRLGRRVLFANKFENDIVSFSTGADGVVPQIGSIIKVSDELRAGERRDGRVVEKLSGTSVKIDAQFTFLSGTSYKLSFIGFDGTVTEVNVTTTNTTTDTVNFTPAFSQALSKNTPYVLTDIGLEAQTFKVVSVSETDQHTYAVSAVKHTPSKYGYIDDLISPVFSDASNLAFGDTVSNISAKEVLYLDGVIIRSKLVVSWEAARFSSSYRLSYTTGSDNITTVETSFPSFDILNTTQGLYDINIISVDILGGASQAANFQFNVLGKLAPPESITNLNVTSFSNSAVISWDLPVDLDVQIGGSVEIRYTSKTTGQRWEDGSLIATVNGGVPSTIAPLLQGTYMAKAVDSSGVYSTLPALADSSFAKIQSLNVVATSVQQPSWLGNRTNTYVKSGSILSLDSQNLWDSLVSIDGVSSIDLLGGQYAVQGEYEFDSVLDLGGVLTSRVSGLIDSFSYESLTQNTIDLRDGNIDSWANIDGSIVNDSYVTMYVSTTPDDPNNISAVWSDWTRLIVTDYEARGFKFKLILTNTSPSNTIDVYRAEVVVDVPDRVEGGDNIVASVGGYTVIYPFPFYVKPSVAVRIDNMQSGDYTEFVSNDANGFTVKFKDSTNTYVSRQFDYISKGYGYVTT